MVSRSRGLKSTRLPIRGSLADVGRALCRRKLISPRTLNLRCSTKPSESALGLDLRPDTGFTYGLYPTQLEPPIPGFQEYRLSAPLRSLPLYSSSH